MSLLSDAVGELYSADPDEFTQRRKELAAQARAAGDRAAAKEITALGKPTRSAWLINRLVRTDPSVPARLAELGDQLRAGEAALDGASIRKLSAARRELVDELVRQATAGLAASATLREEITDTFNAALADPDVTRQLAAGTLLRAVHWAGFSPGIGTADPLTAWAASGPASSSPARPPAARPAAARPPAARPTARAAGGAVKRAADDQAERRRQAEEAAADAALALQAAASAERDRQDTVRHIEAQLADDRQQVATAEQRVTAARKQLAQSEQNLADIRHRVTDAEQTLAKARQDLKAAGILARQAVDAQRKAQQALDRLSR